MSNTFGHIYRFTSFGESHGVAIGGVVDGCPAGLELDIERVQAELDRRRPGQSRLTTQRRESDKVQFLSGLFEGKTTGTPIAFIIPNEDQHSNDYEHLKEVFRPSHADYTYQEKYGIRDYRGGGRASARETAVRIVAGAIAKQVLKHYGISITAYTSQIGNIAVNESYNKLNLSAIEQNAVRCPDADMAEQMITLIQQCQKEGDSVGGVVSCVVKNVPVGLGEPIYDKLQAKLASAMLSINATKGFDYGSGFEGIGMRGSEANDAMSIKSGKVQMLSNHSGGIQGGISNGEDIYFRVAFKPTPTISKEQQTITKELQETTLSAHGRHDACVVPRAVPVVEAMAACVLLDAHLMSRCTKL